LAATRYDTVPLPVPLAPAVIVTHDASSVAVHVQALPVVTTLTVPIAPVFCTLLLAGDTE
jgi:hypothetical protein